MTFPTLPAPKKSARINQDNEVGTQTTQEYLKWFHQAVQIFTLFVTPECSFIPLDKQRHFSNSNWEVGCFLPELRKAEN